MHAAFSRRVSVAFLSALILAVLAQSPDLPYYDGPYRSTVSTDLQNCITGCLRLDEDVEVNHTSTAVHNVSGTECQVNQSSTTLSNDTSGLGCQVDQTAQAMRSISLCFEECKERTRKFVQCVNACRFSTTLGFTSCAYFLGTSDLECIVFVQASASVCERPCLERHSIRRLEVSDIVTCNRISTEESYEKLTRCDQAVARQVRSRCRLAALDEANELRQACLNRYMGGI